MFMLSANELLPSVGQTAPAENGGWPTANLEVLSIILHFDQVFTMTYSSSYGAKEP